MVFRYIRKSARRVRRRVFPRYWWRLCGEDSHGTPKKPNLTGNRDGARLYFLLSSTFLWCCNFEIFCPETDTFWVFSFEFLWFYAFPGQIDQCPNLNSKVYVSLHFAQRDSKRRDRNHTSAVGKLCVWWLWCQRDLVTDMAPWLSSYRREIRMAT